MFHNNITNYKKKKALAREQGLRRIILKSSILQEDPVDRLSRMIKEMFWDSLTRTLDQNGTYCQIYIH